MQNFSAPSDVHSDQAHNQQDFQMWSDQENFFTTKREPDRQDRLIPLINVVFLLLTFFLVAGTFRIADAVKMKTVETEAEGSLGRKSLDKRSDVIYIELSGQITFEDQKLARDQVTERLKQWGQNHQGRTLYIKADKELTADVFLPVLKTISEAGVPSVHLIVTQKRR